MSFAPKGISLQTRKRQVCHCLAIRMKYPKVHVYLIKRKHPTYRTSHIIYCCFLKIKIYHHFFMVYIAYLPSFYMFVFFQSNIFLSALFCSVVTICYMLVCKLFFFNLFIWLAEMILILCHLYKIAKYSDMPLSSV